MLQDQLPPRSTLTLVAVVFTSDLKLWQETLMRALIVIDVQNDFCVAHSTLDAASLGFQVSVDTELCRTIDRDGLFDLVLIEMKSAKVRLV
jgi:nicotinamidase-related amidase